MKTLTILLFFAVIGSSAHAQRPGERPARDITDALTRIDLNRAADLQIITAKKNSAVREAIEKQIREDFRDLQFLHNKMMASAWAKPELDHKHLSEMIGQISKKASRLKSNLGLPQLKNDEVATKRSSEISSPDQFRAELLLLDRSVVSFVQNPIFQKSSVIEVSLANKASKDLEMVIGVSTQLKKMSERLRKERLENRVSPIQHEPDH
jgi:hypothetical protein